MNGARRINLLGFLYLVSLAGLLLFICCAITAPTRLRSRRRATAHLVQRAKDGNLSAYYKVLRIATSNSRGKGRVCEEMGRNRDPLFIPVLEQAYAAPGESRGRRQAVVAALCSHYRLDPDRVLGVFGHWLNNSPDSVESEMISRRLITELREADDLERVFPLFNRLQNEVAHDQLMGSLAGQVGKRSYWKVMPSISFRLGFPLCRRKTVDIRGPEIARIALKDSLSETDVQLLTDNLYRADGIFWTVLGLFRANETLADEVLLEWAEDREEALSWYQAVVISKLKGTEAAVELWEEMLNGSPENCRNCVWAIRDLIESAPRAEEAPEDIKLLAEWIVKQAIEDVVEFENLLGEVKRLRFPDIGWATRRDTVHVWIRGIGDIAPIEIPNKELLVTTDRDRPEAILDSTPRSWCLSLRVRWYRDWVCIAYATRIPGAYLAGGGGEFILKKVDGEWRLASVLFSYIS